jgi:heme/copper-type cytochrome/quinol oxidase subunit 2
MLRLRTTANTLALLLYGPFILGLSIGLWHLAWSAGRHSSAIVWCLVPIALLLFLLGCIVVVLAGWLWWEIRAEERPARYAEHDPAIGPAGLNEQSH